MEVYKTFSVSFDTELVNRKYEKLKPNMLSKSAPAPEVVVVLKHWGYTASVTSSLSSSNRESGLIGVTRVNVTQEKSIPKKKKYIKSKYLSPFVPGNKMLLNEDNYDNTKTRYTSLTEKDDMSHTSPYCKNKWKNNYKQWWQIQGGDIENSWR